jgi:ABC-type glutathione transport system ATPase component
MSPHKPSALPESLPPTNTPKPLIKLHQVVKVYETAAGDFPALRNITAEVYPAEFLGVIGRSGAEKSTLLNMVTGVDHLTSGEVVVHTEGGAVSVHKLSENDLALVTYPPGSWGPDEADQLLARDGRRWRFGCMDVPGIIHAGD